jgi:hypothetical protein
MSPDEIRNLLGGYATGTLTEAEQQALYAAALKDEQLFAALADEQALKELLDDPAARAQLLASLGKRPWWFWKAALIGSAAAAVVLVGILMMRPADHEYAELARVAPPPAAPAIIKSAPPQVQPEQPPALKARPKPPEPAQPSVPADLSKTVAAASDPDLTLRYGIWKLGSTGAYAPADMTRTFEEGDMLRVQVETSDSGRLSISQGGSTVLTASIASGVPTLVPQQGALTPKGGPLHIVFARKLSPCPIRCCPPLPELRQRPGRPW